MAKKVTGARPLERRLRVRSIPLAEIDAEKIGLAVWMMAKRLVAERAQAPAGDEAPERSQASGEGAA